jgi:hypothetical protein
MRTLPATLLFLAAFAAPSFAESLATPADPPPISLHVKNAQLPELTEVLSKALGITMEPGAAQLPKTPAPTFSLDATDQSFWEVFLGLARQHPLALIRYTSRNVALSLQAEHLYTYAAVSGPLAVFPLGIERRRATNFQDRYGVQTTPETMELTCWVFLDPRLRVLHCNYAHFTEIVDDAGNTLFSQSVPVPPPPPTNELGFPMFIDDLHPSAQLKVPAKRGTKITSAKGILHTIVQTSEEHIDVTDLDKKIGQNIQFAGRTLRLSDFTAATLGHPEGLADVRASLEIVNADNAATKPVNPYPIFAALIDAHGAIIDGSNISPKNVRKLGGALYHVPITLRLSTPTAIKQVSFPFELKDLPLP